ncbi:hypothetical protein [Bacillus solimangrovi]|uniref:Uncharacterized protein n=1 Tax=Bacillus solimangrovi TaxID=1305675 RepID=A0A1E5LIK8_9BACI|nr:hypothetical protein [Bacillus solimangrovi]OEH93901.1 hypothetical protein BFG57_10550 [Bacillus solimangrovi]
MRSLQDAIYNWLTIKVVMDARPEDESAQQTFQLFDEILKEDFQAENVRVEKDEIMYLVSVMQEGEDKKLRFPVELIDIMINQIEEEPEKYPNYDTELK